MMLSLMLLSLSALPETYVTVPGDTCDKVTKKFYGDVPGAIAHLHDDNPTMGPPPHKVLATGTTLKISPMKKRAVAAATPAPAPAEPKRPLNRIMAAAKADAPVEPPPPAPVPAPKKNDVPGPISDATLTFVVPQVERRPATSPGWNEATINELLFKLDQVSTRKGAGAELTFNDASRLQLRENALIVVLGPEKKANGERKSSGFELIQGELKLAMAELRKQSMPVTLPGATADAQAREALMSVDGDSMSRICVYEGESKVSAKGKSVTVKTNEGTRVAKGKAPEKPRRLPDPPDWYDLATLVTMTDDPQLPVTLTFGYGPTTTRARLEVADDEAFNSLTYDMSVPTPSAAPGATQMSFASPVVTLKPGHYFARLSSLDSAGLQSRPSVVRRIDVLQMHGAVDHKATIPQAIDVELPSGYELLDGETPVHVPFLLMTPGKHVLSLRKTSDTKIITSTDVEVALPQPSITVQPSGDGARVSALFDQDITGLPIKWADAQTGAVLPEAKPVTREVAATISAPPGATGTAELQYNGHGFASTGWTSGAVARPEKDPMPVDEKPSCATPYLLGDNTVGNAQWAYLDSAKCLHAQLGTVIGGNSAGPQASLAVQTSIPIPTFDALRIQANARTLLTGGSIGNTVEGNLGLGYRIDIHKHFNLGLSADFAANGVGVLRGRGMFTGHSQFTWAEFTGGWGLGHQSSLDNLRNTAFFEVAIPLGEYFHLQAQANVDVPFTHMNRYKFDFAGGVSFKWRWLRLSLSAVIPAGWTADGDRNQFPGGQLTFGYLQ